jgi:hypothetical protein
MVEFRKDLNRGDYRALISYYQQQPRSKKQVLILSLLYQLAELFQSERQLLEDSLHIFPNSRYVASRLKWHNLNDFDKVVPRPEFRANFRSMPHLGQEEFEKLIIITGGDSAFFTWIIETIESVRAGGMFKDVQIGVLDCGLDKNQKNFLYQKFSNVMIKDPGFDFADPSQLSKSWQCGIPDNNINAFKAITSRAFLDKHFPGYYYYFWLDSDAWVQDESVLVDYILLAKKQSVGMSENNMAQYCQETMFYSDKYMTKEMQEAIQPSNMATCAGVLCLTPEFLREWRVLVKELYRQKKIVNNSPTLYCAIHKFVRLPEFLPHRYQFFFRKEGLPLIDENQVLYGAESFEPCGIIHLNGLYGVREKYRYFPTQLFSEKVDLKEHVARSWRAITFSKSNLEIDPTTLDVFPDQRTFSFRYRVWPWRDKELLRNKLFGILEGGGSFCERYLL